MTQLENHMSQPCLTVGMYKIFEFVLSDYHKLLPMGVIDLYFVDNEVEVRCRRKVLDCAHIICGQVGPLSLGAQPVLMM
jgi:hypothetical protein